MTRKKKEKKTDPRLQRVMYNDLPENKGLPFCIISDLDGTLSMMNGRYAYDGGSCKSDVISPAVDYILDLEFQRGTEVFLFSGRNSDKGGREATELWLEDHGVRYSTLAMRAEGDYRKDTVTKQEMFDEYIKGKYRVLFVLDDRNMMVDHWRDMGLECFQVYYGDF